jgi:hypothetical protein
MDMRCLLPIGLLVLAGCGVTMGDPCTTSAECDVGVCLNRDFAPGGYCSKACNPGQPFSCPAGTTCVQGLLARDQPGCMKSCSQQSECRQGYVCRVENGSATAVCIGPAGL